MEAKMDAKHTFHHLKVHITFGWIDLCLAVLALVSAAALLASL
jgi:hypothetical protein